MGRRGIVGAVGGAVAIEERRAGGQWRGGAEVQYSRWGFLDRDEFVPTMVAAVAQPETEERRVVGWAAAMIV